MIRHFSRQRLPLSTVRPGSFQGHARKHHMCRADSSWHGLSRPLLWQGSEAAALQGLPVRLSPPWKVMLLSDGSVTRHLQLLTGLVVSVDCLQMERIARESVEDLPEQVETIRGDLVQRQVFLRSPGEDHLPLVYAASWWSADHVDEFLRDKQQPIWASLSQGHIELFREIQQVHYGNSEFLAESFREKGPFLGRHYLFWHHDRPLTVIYEVFSPKLSRWLGPMHQ